MLYFSILVLGAIASLLGPWWMLPLVAAILCGLKAQSSKQAFWISAAAGMSLWAGYSLILIFSGKENLVDKIAGLFAGNSAFLAKFPSLGLILLLVTLVSGLSVGLAGLAGRHIKLIGTRGV